MRKITPYLILGICCVTFCPRPAAALVFSAPNPKIVLKDASGKNQSIEIVDKYYPKKIVQPFAGRLDDRSEAAPSCDYCRGTRSCTFALEMLALCEGSAVCRRRSDVSSTDDPRKTSWPRAREELRLQETPGVRPISGTGWRSVGL